ncbi:MAG: pyruvate dehydrogenase (acetyl-transferring) E1 component subunit alpha [Alphaproteobacteria bacterium]|nr:pyruvate dehydrogenase (acetyl-transferring) E1 component subunit alpha [Alphaproteobacteria bacterium]
MTTKASFTIRHHRCLDPAGNIEGCLPAFAEDGTALTPLYRSMVRLRRFDAKAVALQRTGRLGTYAVTLGQEAIPIGVASAMRADDVLLPSYRDGGALLWRGVTMEELLLYWGGDERGSNFSASREDFPFSVPIASHCLHAVGVAYAMKQRREQRAAVCMIGDGATSNGAFYEAINAAGAWRAPAVFVISNNQWAISMPRSAQTAAETLAQKAIAAGMPGEQVDGNDVIAVREVMAAALERARRGDGPSVIEALTYRLGDHTTADDASRYRDPEVLKAAWAEEPIARLRAYLVDQGHWNEADEKRLIGEIDEEIEAAVACYLATPPQPVSTMFDYLHAELPKSLEEQRQAAIDAASGGRHD